MTISDVLTPERVVIDLRAVDKRRMLEDLARRSAKPADLDPDMVFHALAARERLGSTGMGAGIAIPHARFPALSRPIGFFARLKAAVEFEAIDGGRVDLVFLLLQPAEGAGGQINALACVARRLRDEAVVAVARRARDRDSLYAVLIAGDEKSPFPPQD